MQIKKEEKELTRAWGTSAIQAKIEDLSVPQEGRTTTIMLFGNARECEVAQVLSQALCVLSGSLSEGPG